MKLVFSSKYTYLPTWVNGWVRGIVGDKVIGNMFQECLKRASIILQAKLNMLQECFNMFQLPSPDEGHVNKAKTSENKKKEIEVI